MKLKIELFRYGTVVLGKVLEQDEELRGRGIIAEKNGFIVKSSVLPELFDDKFYIRGENTLNDDRCFVYIYNTEAKAIQICQTIVELVDKINGSKSEETAIERVL